MQIDIGLQVIFLKVFVFFIENVIAWVEHTCI